MGRLLAQLPREERQDASHVLVALGAERAGVAAARRDPQLFRLAGRAEERVRVSRGRRRVLIVGRMDEEEPTRRDARDRVARPGVREPSADESIDERGLVWEERDRDR